MKLTFVTPWWGPEARGGAETACRQTALRLAAAGLDVEVLTTCSRSFLSAWDHDDYRAGEGIEAGVRVRRFACRRRDRSAFDAINRKLLKGEAISATEETTFVAESINSPDLVDFIAQNAGDRVFVFIPYLYGTTVQGAMAAPARSVLIPCLHDEAYARLAPVRAMFESVRGIGFLSAPERELAQGLYRMQDSSDRMLGLGVEGGRGDAARFRARHGSEPFVLYVGRKDATKGTPLLIEAFLRYKFEHPGPLRLLLAGPGAVDTKGSPFVADLGYLPEDDKHDAFAAAAVFCNPSWNESFSIVLMEAWLAGTPALVHARCAVTRDHVRRAKGGLYFHTPAEFAAALDLLLDPALGPKMGANGRRYVQLNFTWDAVVRRYLAALRAWGFADIARLAT